MLVPAFTGPHTDTYHSICDGCGGTVGQLPAHDSCLRTFFIRRHLLGQKPQATAHTPLWEFQKHLSRQRRPRSV